MKQEQVDLFLSNNADNLPADKIEELRAQLVKLPESKEGALVTLPIKNATLILILAILLGGFGVDRFMLGDTVMGVLKIITCGGCGIWCIIDWFTAKNRARQYNYNKLQAFIAQ